MFSYNTKPNALHIIGGDFKMMKKLLQFLQVIPSNMIVSDILYAVINDKIRLCFYMNFHDFCTLRSKKKRKKFVCTYPI